MKVIYTDRFKRDLQKIKDNNVRERVIKLVQKLIDNPNIGKPLKYDLVGLRSVRVSPFRIVYEMKLCDHIISWCSSDASECESHFLIRYVPPPSKI